MEFIAFIKRPGLFILIPLALAGCVTPQQAMQGKIGCHEDQIQILSSSAGMGLTNTTWTVACRGRKFMCSQSPHSQDLNEMSCAEMSGSTGLLPKFRTN